MTDEIPPATTPEPDLPIDTIDTTVPVSARIWNYWLGGTDNFPVDRAAGDEALKIFPGMADAARESRAFLVRSVRYLAGEAGIRQFLDIGAGLPTADNTHQIAQRVAPESRTLYVDNDPFVLAHGRALLAKTPDADARYIHGDLYETDALLENAARILDFERPIALMLMGILGHVADYEQARSIVKRLVDALPSGSHLALNDGARAVHAEFEEVEKFYNERSGAMAYHLRTPEELAGLFDGLELVEPGVVSCSRWRPESAELPPEADVFGGVGRKP